MIGWILQQVATFVGILTTELDRVNDGKTIFMCVKIKSTFVKFQKKNLTIKVRHWQIFWINVCISDWRWVALVQIFVRYW
jgi:hypothetical protein